MRDRIDVLAHVALDADDADMHGPNYPGVR
jgi:hypothetical protein